MFRRKTTKELCTLFLQSKSIGGLKGSTISNYYNKLNNHILPNLPKLSHEINEKEVYKLIQTMSCKLARKSLIDMIVFINDFLKFAKEKKYVKQSIQIPCPSKRKKEIIVLNEQEQMILENYLLNNLNHFNFGVLLALFTGIRIGELSALQFKNFQTDILKIEKTLQRIKNISKSANNKTIITIDVPKSGSKRKIPLNSFILKVYSEIIKSKLEYYLLTGNEKFIEPRNIDRGFKRILKECNIPQCNFHALRHTFATNCVMSGMDIKTLAEILGHSNTSIALEYYIFCDFEYKRKSMENLKPKMSQSI